MKHQTPVVAIYMVIICLFSLTACSTSELSGSNKNQKPESEINYSENLADTWNVKEEILSHSNDLTKVGDVTTYELKITQDSEAGSSLTFEDGTNIYNGLHSNRKVDFAYNYPLSDITGYTVYIFETNLTVSANGSTISGTFSKQIQSDDLLLTISSEIKFTATRNIEDEYENNDTLASATDTISQATYDGNQFDDDWYAFTPNIDKLRLQINLTFNHNEGDIDLELYNSLGTLLLSATSQNDNESMDIEVSLSETYYLRVFGEDDGNRGNPYSLTWNNIQP